jgi:hypothetical protein
MDTRRRCRRRTEHLLALITATSLILGIPAAAGAYPADSGPSGWAYRNASHKKVHLLMRRARATGAKKKAIRRILKRKSPTKSIPVKFRLKGGKKVKNGVPVAAIAGAGKKCYSGKTLVAVMSGFTKLELGHIEMHQQWCSNARQTKVTDVLTPEFSWDTTIVGTAERLHWKGPNGFKDYFDNWNGHAKGRHATHRRFVFSFCPFGTGLCWDQLHPWLLMSKRANGTYIDRYYFNCRKGKCANPPNPGGDQ